MDVRLDLFVDWQARAVLAALDGAFDAIEGTDCLRIRTYQLYNGREMHAAIVAERGLCGPALLISFGECRNSDSLMVSVEHLERAPFNQPVCAMLGESGYHSRDPQGNHRLSFEPGDIMSATKHIVEQVERLLEPSDDDESRDAQ